MLEFVKGNPQNPTGNLIAYCKVIGPNPIEPDARYLLCNIMVSFLGTPEENFPVVVFPPVPAFDHQELQSFFAMRPNYDIIRIPDFAFPEGMDEEKYVEERLDDLNHLVIEYVDLCKESCDFPEFGFASAEDEFFDNHHEEDEKLSDEEVALLRLEEGLQQKESPFFASEIPRILQYIKTTYPRYDVENLRRVLQMEKGHPKLPGLYLKKFQAIFREEYERAALLQSQIQSLESSM